MRVLVTGVTGRIGANLAASLVTAGHDVRGLVWARDARTDKLAGVGLDLIEGTLTDRAAVNRAVDGVQAIYHMGGAFQGGGPFTPDEYFDINVRGTFNVLEAARALSTLDVLAIASTDAIYDKYVPGGVPDPISEDAPVRPSGLYAVTKAQAEALGLGYARSFGMPVVALRFALVVGAGEFATFPQFFAGSLRKLRGASLHLPDGTPDDALVSVRMPDGRPWRKHVVDVRDIVGACLACLGRPAAHGHAIQLGAPSAFTWDEVVPDLAARLERPWVTGVDDGIPTDYAFDLHRCRTLLGYEPKIDTARTVIDAVAHLRGESIGVLPTG
jgi:nucleoside-diphosphate-sugar epimerase